MLKRLWERLTGTRPLARPGEERTRHFFERGSSPPHWVRNWFRPALTDDIDDSEQVWL